MPFLTDYPAALIKFQEKPEATFVFLNEKARERYIFNLVKDTIPHTKTLTMTNLKAYLETENVTLSYKIVECEKNLGKGAWPMTYACSLCDSTDIVHKANLIWDIAVQNWRAQTVDQEANCLNCKSVVIPKDVILPVELNT